MLKISLKRRQRGVTMTEALLAVGVSMLMLTWAGRMQAQAAEDLRAKNTAEQMQSIKTLAQQYFKTNRTAIIGAMDTGASAATWCSVNDTVKKLCVVDVAKLIANGAAPAATKTVTPQNQLIQITYRLVNLASGQTEVLVFGGTNSGNQTAMKNESAALAAQFMGENGGMVPAVNTGACATTQACGVMGGWLATLSNYTTGTLAATPGSVASYSIVI